MIVLFLEKEDKEKAANKNQVNVELISFIFFLSSMQSSELDTDEINVKYFLSV